MKKAYLFAGALFSCCLLTGCDDQDGKTAWNKILAKCAVSDLNGPHVMYFGPSNVIGPGSIWRKADDKAFRVRYDISDLPFRQNYITQGNNSPCDGSSTSSFSFKAAADLTASPLAISADVANDLEKATSVTAKATTMHWDVVREGPYEDDIKALPHDNGIWKEMTQGNRLVMVRALRVSGFSVTLTFKASDAASLKAAYNGPLSKDVTGNVSGSLNASWSNDGKLTLTAANDFYIAGEIAPYAATGFQKASPAVAITSVNIPSGVKLGRERVK